jgi:hypothetical protein
MPGATELINCDKKGSEVSLYYDTADDPSAVGGSNCATPVWVYHKGITGDLSINDTEDEEELSVRDPDQLYKQYSESKADLEISGEQAVEPGYEGYIYLNAARNGSFARNFLVLTGYLTELLNVGFRGKFRNFDRSITGPESGASKANFKLKPAACVRSGCKITPVKTAAASTITTYDPGAFVALSTKDLIESITSHSIYKAINRTTAEEIFTEVGPLIGFLGADTVDSLLTSLVEASPIPRETRALSTRRSKPVVTGMGGFNRADLLEALNEIVKNGG